MCDCIEKIDEKLKAGGQCLNATMSFHGEPQRPAIALLRLDNYKVETRRGKPGFMQANFCAWCGEKYETPPPTATAAALPDQPAIMEG